jgi:mannose-6-phosphate isomerase-like protein (cupin superfamily)
MVKLVTAPTVVAGAGVPPVEIEEYAGRISSGHGNVSVARLVSQEGWSEPRQKPDFAEISLVLKGMLRVESEGGVVDARSGQAVVTSPGEWVRYSTPEAGGAEYIAVCVPAFSLEMAHRDE